MKEVFFALIVWSGGNAGAYDFASERACVALTRDIALSVESANCYSRLDPASYQSAPMMFESLPPIVDYFPPAE